MRLVLPVALLALPGGAPAAFGGPPAGFRGPQVVDAGLQAAWVAVGDLNRDRTLDLAVVEGSDRVSIFFQDPARRGIWTPLRLSVGLGSNFVLAADFDADGDDDLAIADPASSAYVLYSRGDRTFEPPAPLREARGPRWLAAGDFNGDGRVDLATADFMARICSIFLNRGDGTLAFSGEYRVNGYPHAIRTLDFDGDGRLDLMAKLSDVGILPLRGSGDGTFEGLPLITNLGNDGNIAAGDFNHDGKGDLAINCCGAGVSLGDGAYRNALSFEGFGPVEFADLNRDGRLDIAQLLSAPGQDGRNLLVYPGKGDGSFSPPAAFEARGLTTPFLEDLDGDGLVDLVSGTSEAAGLVVVWGTEGQRPLELGFPWKGFTTGRVVAVSRPRPGEWPDVSFPSSSQPEVHVYKNEAWAERAAPSYTIRTASIYTSLVRADLDGDGLTDLAGANRTRGVALVSLLGPAGQPREEFERPAGLLPSAAVVDFLDGDHVPDLAVACTGSGEIAVFLGQGRGVPGEAAPLPTIEGPKDLAAGDFNGDGRADLAVLATAELAIHTAQAEGGFSAPISLIKAPARYHSGLAAADVNGDGLTDLLVLEARSSSVDLFRGRGNGSFEPPVSYQVGRFPVSLALGDVDGDGLVDITVACGIGQSVSVLLNLREGGFARLPDQWIGFSPLAHVLADLDLDGAPDLLVARGNAAVVFPSRRLAPPVARFRRGDTDGSGRVELNDAVLALSRLFLGGDPLACEDAADADDSGDLDLADPIRVLFLLFLGGEPLPPPGPHDCGRDPTPDLLAACPTGC